MFPFLQDFGDSIPGHGGITDRMDCQVDSLDVSIYKFILYWLYLTTWEIFVLVGSYRELCLNIQTRFKSMVFSLASLTPEKSSKRGKNNSQVKNGITLKMIVCIMEILNKQKPVCLHFWPTKLRF